ncbi:MAG: methionyl-tRNA formyltransferase, partial [Rhodospirillales bacterium]|nr:methionyl-tRNA formyltransferase [Rhodospirillales bacterium]
KVLAAEMMDEPAHGEEAGTVLDDAISVVCGDGALRLLRLQRAGKGAQEAAEFLRGFPLARGSRLT